MLREHISPRPPPKPGNHANKCHTRDRGCNQLPKSFRRRLWSSTTLLTLTKSPSWEASICTVWTGGMEGSSPRQTDDLSSVQYPERPLREHPPSCLRKPAQLPKPPPEGANAHHSSPPTGKELLHLGPFPQSCMMMEHPSNPWAASLQPVTGSPPT